MSMATVRISEAEAAGDFAGLMARVRAGDPGVRRFAQCGCGAGSEAARARHRPARCRSAVIAPQRPEKSGRHQAIRPDRATAARHG